jgi:hypothetical protein
MVVRQPDTLFTLACDEFGKHFIDYDTADKFLDNLEFNRKFRKRILYDFDETRNIEGFYDYALEPHWDNTRDFFSVILKGGEKRHCLMACFYGGVEVGHVMFCVRFFPFPGVNQKQYLLGRCRASLPPGYKQCLCVGEVSKSNFCDMFPVVSEPPTKKQKLQGPLWYE